MEGPHVSAPVTVRSSIPRIWSGCAGSRWTFPAVSERVSHDYNFTPIRTDRGVLSGAKSMSLSVWWHRRQSVVESSCRVPLPAVAQAAEKDHTASAGLAPRRPAPVVVGGRALARAPPGGGGGRGGGGGVDVGRRRSSLRLGPVRPAPANSHGNGWGLLHARTLGWEQRLVQRRCSRSGCWHRANCGASPTHCGDIVRLNFRVWPWPWACAGLPLACSSCLSARTGRR